MIKFENNPWQYSTDHEINHLPVVKKREMLQSNLKNLTTITSFLKKKIAIKLICMVFPDSSQPSH